MVIVVPLVVCVAGWRTDLPKVRKNPLVEIIPLSTGCLGACTYCKTKHARGQLGSYEPSAILERAKTVIEVRFQAVDLISLIVLSV